MQRGGRVKGGTGPQEELSLLQPATTSLPAPGGPTLDFPKLYSEAHTPPPRNPGLKVSNGEKRVPPDPWERTFFLVL